MLSLKITSLRSSRVNEKGRVGRVPLRIEVTEGAYWWQLRDTFLNKVEKTRLDTSVLYQPLYSCALGATPVYL